MDDKLIAFFWAHVTKTPTCWNWTGPIDGHSPYLNPRVGGVRKTLSPRRVSMEIHGKNITANVFTSCKNKLCVNPEHLVSGVEGRFWSKIQKLSQANGGCWIWLGGFNDKGYGVLHNNRTCYAHRYSWELVYGPIKSQLAFVCHTCDNPKCVNPNHLFLGDNNDNVQDKVSKGRQARGHRPGIDKLTEEKVKEIRQLYTTGQYTCRQLATQFSVSKSTIIAVIARKQWKHVP